MKPRARAIAVPGQSESMPWLAWLLLLSLALAFATLGGAQAATTQAPAMGTDRQAEGTPDQGNGTIKPHVPDIAKGSTPGVLKPKTNPDPGMTVATPNPEAFPTPVIPPPGTAGNNPQVVPK